MNYWPWYASGAALSAVMLFHWFSLRRMMAVSGRFTGLVDRLRHGATEPEPEMTTEQLLAALQAATLAEFGANLQTAAPSEEGANSKGKAQPKLAATVHPALHVLFLASLVAGGLLSALLGGIFSPTLGLGSVGFSRAVGESPYTQSIALLLGGVFVGFGTRMAGGCTSGHGLCGTSRLQPGSIVATISFFGAGILASFALGAL